MRSIFELSKYIVHYTRISNNLYPTVHWIAKTDVSARPFLLLYSSMDEHEKALGLRGAQTEIECIWAYRLASDHAFPILVDNISAVVVHLMTGAFFIITHSTIPFSFVISATVSSAVKTEVFVCAQRIASLNGIVCYCWRGKINVKYSKPRDMLLTWN